MISEVYEPGEDSYLLQKHVKNNSNVNSVLDMGTGTGIQAITAAKDAKEVIAVDINPDALSYAKSELKGIKNIKLKQSDLFSKVPKKKFDLIIFNPPYLPKEKKVDDVALFSGKRGVDTTIRFLDEVSKYLNDNGVVLMISSSLASQALIDDAFKKNLLDSEILESEHIFFEDIFVHKIKKSRVHLDMINIGLKESILFNHGKRGVIIKGKYGRKTVCVKIKKEESTAVGTVLNEARFLEVLNKAGIGPKLIKYTEEYLMYVYAEGILIEEFLEKSKKKDILIVLKEVFSQCRKMDEMNINKFEMHHPYKHILIGDNNKVVLIDFERCRHTIDPKNVTQFCDYLSSDHIFNILAGKKISYDRGKLREMSKRYKHEMNHKNFDDIIDFLV